MAIDYVIFALLERCQKIMFFWYFVGGSKNQKSWPKMRPRGLPAVKGDERGMISVAVGNIPAPGLGKLGAMLIWFHAEMSVKSTLRESTY